MMIKEVALSIPQTMLQRGKATLPEALDLFDQLEPVELNFMTGRWQGSGFHTGHPMDGLLEVANWYGKEFVNPDCVHPLLFSDSQDHIFKLLPIPSMMSIGMNLPIPKNEGMKSVFSFFNPLLKTEDPQARLRMTEYRGKVSATMIYDHLPINDIFRKVDENTLLGLMDCKVSPQPFFFVLKRESAC